ncbi:hypothetical protein ACJDT4_09325 [Clostridium neuense]|uniref:DUF4258 domain-containing protein n=1 Tax=Clostridium neuense TaxID=1728934 RepID=A0ABW8TI66_9CLOT
MEKIILDDKEFEVVLENKIIDKLEKINKTKKQLIDILNSNKQELEDVDENEDFMLEGDFVVAGYKMDSKIFIIAVIKKENIY